MGQIVMSVFYGVDPSDVQKQTGDFGTAFNETCASRTEEERRKWSQALTYVGNIAGEHFQNWGNEAEMIEKIARDVSDKLNATPCKDFDGMVGLDDHLKEMESFLDLDNVGVKVVGISGPAGIGKSTNARALHSRLSNRFQHTCFVEKLRENYKNGRDVYGSKLSLHEHLLSKILNQNGMHISNLGVIEQRLRDKKVLIILDDVESLDQLETLANIIWFGAGSRVIVTTENKEILQQHGINDIYQVGFPSEREALMIFCLSAFRQTFPPNGFMYLSGEVASLCGNLPLGLSILGSSLRGKSEADWIDELPQLKNCLNREIESVLKVGYESLIEKDQALFLHIAIFFNYENVDHVISMLEKSNLDVKVGLNILANKYLIHIDGESRVVMHNLLQVMARQVISKQKPWKGQILVDTQEISSVLEDATGDGSTKGVSFDVDEIDELMINPRAFEKMCNLLFLKVYNVGCHTGKRKLHIPEDIEFPRRIRLFHWDAYQGKSLPLRFSPANLIELNVEHSELEKLWEGSQLLANLKKINLSWSSCLKELPDLSDATNLEDLNLSFCTALVELPSSITNLHKLNSLMMIWCESLEVVPTLINLVSLTFIQMFKCPRLTRFPEIPINIEILQVTNTTLEEVPASLTHCFCLEVINISGSVNLKTFLTQLPMSVEHINLSGSGIERITDCIKGLHYLRRLLLSGCKRLASLPELPRSLKLLQAEDCESLERVSCHLNTPNAELHFTNCFKLDREARQAIIQQSFVRGWALLPGTEVPAEFDHRARGNSLRIPLSAFTIFKVCVVISPNHHQAICNSSRSRVLLHRWTIIGNSVNSDEMKFKGNSVKLQKAHLFIFHSFLPFIFHIGNVMLEFSSEDQDFDIIECGVQILRAKIVRSNNGGSGDEDSGWDTDEFDESSDKEEENNDNAAKSESSEASEKEDNEEGYKSESGELSEDKDEDIADDRDYKSVSRKRPRTTMITNLKWRIKKQRS